MTETEAYRKLGWNPNGEKHTFVLPTSGSTRTDWMAFECPVCKWRGVSLPEAFVYDCPGCGGEMEVV